MTEENPRNHSNVPALLDRARAAGVAAPALSPISLPGGWEWQPEQVAIPLSHYLWILRRHRWKILSTIGAFVIATIVISSRLTPIYESTATIDIDRRIPTGVLGQEALQASTNDADQFLATQIKLVQSDSVLRPVADKYNLRELENTDWTKKGLKNTEAEDTPVILKKMKVTRPPNTYLLLISYRSKDKRLAADVANGIAQSYLEHTYDIRYRAAAGLSQFMEKQQEELKAKMERSSAALAQFERELNVISPEEKTNIVSARLLQLNTEYTNAQSDRVKKQAAWQSIQGGSMEAALVSSQADALKKLTENFNDAEQKFADVRTRFGENHPEYKRAAAAVEEGRRELTRTQDSIRQRVQLEYQQALSREKMLENAVKETKAEFDRLNARSFDYQTLKREADADKSLYEELVRKIKEASINASFQNSSIRIADAARPGLKAVFPNMTLNVALALLFSTLFAVGGAVIADALDNTIRDPEQVTRSLRTSVVGTLPMVKNLRGQLRPLTVHNNNGSVAPSAPERIVSGFDEAVRTIRNSILLTDFDQRLRSVLMTSASPSEGKSTVAVHLATVHAEQRNKTLLIDGDLRRPSVHKFFDIPNNLGLSKVLVYDFPWREALVQPRPDVELYILPAGPSTRRASDLIGKGLPQLLEEAALEFDLVILDAPPLLGFPEPLQMAAAVDGVIIVTRAGQTNRSAVASVLATLQRLRAHVVGIVLNEVRKELSHSYYYYGYYGKYYRERNHASPYGG